MREIDYQIEDYMEYCDSKNLSRSTKFHEYGDYIITQLIFNAGMRIGETLLIRIDEIIQTKEIKEYSNSSSTRGVDELFSAKSIKTIEELKENMHKEVEHNIFGKAKILDLVINGKAYKIRFYELEGEEIVNVNSEELIVLN